MGIGLDALTIQEISDDEGYLDALGKRRTAEVKRDAEIGQAEANRDSKIKASLALQEGEKVRLATEALIAQSNRETEIQKAQVAAEIEKERAKARQAGPLSEAQAKQEVVAEEVRIERFGRRNKSQFRNRKFFARKKNSKRPSSNKPKPNEAPQFCGHKVSRKRRFSAEGRKQAEIAQRRSRITKTAARR